MDTRKQTNGYATTTKRQTTTKKGIKRHRNGGEFKLGAKSNNHTRNRRQNGTRKGTILKNYTQRDLEKRHQLIVQPTNN